VNDYKYINIFIKSPYDGFMEKLIAQQIHFGVRRVMYPKYAFMTKIIYLNLFHAHCAGKDFRLSRAPRNYNPIKYNRPTPDLFSANAVPDVIDKNVRLGFLIEHRGYKIGNIRRATWLEPAAKLLNLFRQIPFEKRRKYTTDELVVMRTPKKNGQKGEPQPYKDNAYTLENKRIISEINRFNNTGFWTAAKPDNSIQVYDFIIESHLNCKMASDIAAPVDVGFAIKAKVPGERFILTDIQLYRVFNQRETGPGKIEVGGGRFYGSVHMNMPKIMRRTMQVNGQDLAELDYSALHITMCYHMAGLSVTDYPYLIKNIRTLGHVYSPEVATEMVKQDAKLMILTALNSNSNLATLRSFRKEKLYRGHGQWIKIQGFSSYSRRLLKEVLHIHKPISLFLGTSAGFYLMLKDSNIMLNVLSRLISRNIYALPVHDSVIVPVRHIQIAEKIMVQEYARKFGQEIQVTRKS